MGLIDGMMNFILVILFMNCWSDKNQMKTGLPLTIMTMNRWWQHHLVRPPTSSEPLNENKADLELERPRG
jgi:hypothetical protein